LGRCPQLGQSVVETKTDLLEVVAVVRLGDVRVGQVLETIAQLVAAFVAENPAETDVITEIEPAAEDALLVDPGFR
jgi:hypothetical protein